jgi:hypothetical protein
MPMRDGRNLFAIRREAPGHMKERDATLRMMCTARPGPIRALLRDVSYADSAMLVLTAHIANTGLPTEADLEALDHWFGLGSQSAFILESIQKDPSLAKRLRLDDDGEVYFMELETL